jgi:hypothetical protein
MILSKTEDLNANVEKKIEFNGGLHLKIKNLGEDTVYISQHSSIVASADGVKSIQAQTTDIVTDVAKYSIEGSVGDYRGTIYALATKDCQIELEATNNPNFSLKLKGGGEVIASNTLDNTLNDGKKYQLGILSSDITLTLPERANDDIEVDFAISDTVYNINCDYLQLNVVENTYYQIIFNYDKSLNTWFSSVVSSDYNSTSTISEVEENESN